MMVITKVDEKRHSITVNCFTPSREEISRLGGKARAKKLSGNRRSEIARMGGKAGGRGRK